MRLKKAFHYEPAAKANKDRTIHLSNQFDLHSFPSCTHSFFFVDYQNDAIGKNCIIITYISYFKYSHMDVYL